MQGTGVVSWAVVSGRRGEGRDNTTNGLGNSSSSSTSGWLTSEIDVCRRTTTGWGQRAASYGKGPSSGEGRNNNQSLHDAIRGDRSGRTATEKGSQGVGEGGAEAARAAWRQ